MMTKTGRVEPGKTISAVSGKTSTEIRNGEAVAKGEKPPESLVKIARKLDL